MNLATSLHAELVNLVLFAALLLKVGFCTGLIFIVPIAVIDTFLREPQFAAKTATDCKTLQHNAKQVGRG